MVAGRYYKYSHYQFTEVVLLLYKLQTGSCMDSCIYVTVYSSIGRVDRDCARGDFSKKMWKLVREDELQSYLGKS